MKNRTNGDNYLLLIRIAQELGLEPDGVVFADLYEAVKLHPISILRFAESAEKVKKALSQMDLLRKLRKQKRIYQR